MGLWDKRKYSLNKYDHVYMSHQDEPDQILYSS